MYDTLTYGPRTYLAAIEATPWLPVQRRERVSLGQLWSDPVGQPWSTTRCLHPFAWFISETRSETAYGGWVHDVVYLVCPCGQFEIRPRETPYSET